MDIPAIIEAAASVIAAVAATTATIRSIANGKLGDRMRVDIADIHLLINSRMDALLKVSIENAMKEGAEAARLAHAISLKADKPIPHTK